MKRSTVFMFIVFAFLISSCSLHTAYNKRAFILSPTVNYNSKHKTNLALEIIGGNCDSRFNSTLFYYKKNSYEFEPYATICWIDSLCSMFENDLTTAIQQSGMFKVVGTVGSFYEYDYKLKFTIEDFEPVFEKNGSYILTRITFFLFKGNNEPVGSYMFAKKIKLTDIHPPSVVKKMNLADRQAVLGVLNWLEGVVK